MSVGQHPALAHAGDDAWLAGRLKLAVDLPVDHDLNRGDELVVSVSDAAGNVQCHGAARVIHVGFGDIKDGARVVGTERQHKAELA